MTPSGKQRTAGRVSRCCRRRGWADMEWGGPGGEEGGRRGGGGGFFQSEINVYM